MKKTKKLALNPETLRRLSDRQTVEAAGGLNTLADTCATCRPVGCGGQTNRHNWC